MGGGAKSRIVAMMAVAVFGGTLVAGVARASTTTLGETALTPSLTAPPIATGLDIPVFQGAAASGYVMRATHDGTVVSWRFLSAGIVTGRHFVLRVLEPVGAAGMQWKAVGTSAAAAIVSETGTDAINGPFATSLPIKEGDAIAIEPTDGSETPSHEGTIGADGIRYFVGALAEGETGEVLSQEDNGQRVPIQATIEYTPAGPPPSEPSPPSAPTNVTAPSVAGASGGRVTPGHALTCSAGMWTGASALNVRWYQQAVAPKLPARVSAPRLLRGGPTLTVPGLKPGKEVLCRVTASVTGGPSAVLSTSPVVVGAVKPTLLSARLAGRFGSLPRVISRVAPGNLDTCTSGVWLDHPSSFKYTWRLTPARGRGAAAKLITRVVGRSPTIKVRTAFAGRDLVCQVTATNEAGKLTVSSVPASVPRLSELFGPPVSCGEHVGSHGCPGTGINVIVPGQPAGKSLNPSTTVNTPLVSYASPPSVPDASHFLLECEPPRFSRKATISYTWAVDAIEFFSDNKFVEGGFVGGARTLPGHFITLDHGLFVDHESENPEFGYLAWNLVTSDDKGHRVEKVGFFGFGEVAVSCTATGSAPHTSDWGTSPIVYLDGRSSFGYTDTGVIGYAPVSPDEEEAGFHNE